MKSAGLAAPADTVIAADAIARDVLGQAKEPGKANIGSELNCVPFELLGGQTPSGKPSCQGWALRRDKVVRHNHGSAVGHGSKPQFLIPARIEHSQSRNSGFRIGLFGNGAWRNVVQTTFYDSPVLLVFRTGTTLAICAVGIALGVGIARAPASGPLVILFDDPPAPAG